MTLTFKPQMQLWLSDARGVYIPRDFANSFTDRATHVSGVSADDWTVLENPHHESYWDVWTDVLDNAVVTDTRGTKYRLHQDGDLWLVPEGMEWSDSEGTFVWPESETDNTGEEK
jgi:hypothetical protein